MSLNIDKRLDNFEELLDNFQFFSGNLSECPNCNIDTEVLKIKSCPSCGYSFLTFHKLNEAGQ